MAVLDSRTNQSKSRVCNIYVRFHGSNDAFCLAFVNLAGTVLSRRDSCDSLEMADKMICIMKANFLADKFDLQNRIFQQFFDENHPYLSCHFCRKTPPKQLPVLEVFRLHDFPFGDYAIILMTLGRSWRIF